MLKNYLTENDYIKIQNHHNSSHLKIFLVFQEINVRRIKNGFIKFYVIQLIELISHNLQ